MIRSAVVPGTGMVQMAAVLPKMCTLKREFGTKLNPLPPRLTPGQVETVSTQIYRYYRQLVSCQHVAGKKSKVAPLQCAKRQAEIFTACLVHRLSEGYVVSGTKVR